MTIGNFMEDGEIIMWSALAAKEKGIITDTVYSGILSGEINPMKHIPEEFLERRLYKTGGLSGYYQ